MYGLNFTSKYMKSKLIELRGEIDKCTVIVGDLEQQDKKSVRMKKIGSMFNHRDYVTFVEHCPQCRIYIHSQET